MYGSLRVAMAGAAVLGGSFALAQGLPPTGFEPGEPFPLEHVLQDAGSGDATALLPLHDGKKTLFIAYASW